MSTRLPTFPQHDDYRVTRFDPKSIFRVEMQMIRTRTLLTGVFVVLLFLLPALSQVARAQTVRCDNSKAESVIPAKEGKPLMPEEIQSDAGIMEKLKAARPSLTVEDIRRCLKNDEPLKNHVIDFDEYVDTWRSIKGQKPSPHIENSVLWSFKEKGRVNLAAFARDTEEANGKVTHVVTGQIQWRNVTLGPSFSAGGIEFPLIASFVNSRFPSRTDFSKTTFGIYAYFEAATFGDEVSFVSATFRGGSFYGATFGNNTRFAQATFGKGMSFAGATFGHNTRFSNSAFRDIAAFTKATFGENASFLGATFGDGVYFLIATFGDNASFKEATFGNNISFKQVTFGDGTRFENATFGDNTSFKETTFGNDTSFKEATFGNGTSFGSANFRAASFLGVTFGDQTSFSRTAFHDSTLR